MRAVLLDAFGTLVELEPPGPLLARELARRLGVVVSEADADRAMRAEIAYYRRHHARARDAASLADLRARCAGVVAAELGLGGALEGPELIEALLAALRFRPFPDVVPALGALRGRGVRLVVVSDWDVSLHEMLARTGLEPLVDGAVATAVVGVAKPDPAPFRRALALAGVAAGEALHVGDSVALDVAGARAAGIEPVLLRRPGTAATAAPAGAATVRSLLEVVALLDAGGVPARDA